MQESEQLTSKLPDVGTTIFAVMSKMAHDHGAINLSQGFPDFQVSRELISLINKAMVEDKNQYAPMPGLPALRAGISNMIEHNYRFQPDPDNEILVTAGATQAIYTTLTALVHPGDEVIIFDPAYDCYDPTVRLSGGIPVHIPLKQPDFSIDWQAVRDKITQKTKVLMINSPHNPSGAVITGEDLKEMEEIVLRHNLLILSDEVYEHIIFDNIEHESVLKSEVLRKNSVVVFSFGKTFHATGWKVGYLISPSWINTEIKRVHQFVTFTVNTPVQWGLSEYVKDPGNYEDLSDFYQEKRDYFLEQIKDSRFEAVPCHGTYFQVLSYKNISDLPDMKMAEMLTKEHGVASIPVSVFYADKKDDRVLRFCFAKNEETLKKAADILCKI